MSSIRVPVNDLARHSAPLNSELQAVAARVIASGWYILGSESTQFETAFSAYCGVRHTIGVGNGTDAIELALRAVGVKAGDAIVTAANAGFYTTASAMAIGARPVFADVDASDHMMTPATLRPVLDRHAGIKAVVVTHMFGRLADVETLVAICKAAGIPMIEDCAQAHGARRNGRHAGSFGVAGCFSFYPTKNLGAVGDGGAVITGDDRLALTLRSLRQYGWSEKYHATMAGGRNSRLDELQAAILSAKLPRLDGWNAKRREIAEALSRGISHPRVICPLVTREDYVAHLYVVRCKDREGLRTHLHARGVRTDIHYPVPDHRQPAFATSGHQPHLPVTEQLASEVLTLPCFPEMTREEVELVIAAVNEWKSAD